MAKEFKISPPWVKYYREIEALFGEDPDINIPAEDREVGGLGVFMVKQMMDDMDYSYHTYSYKFCQK